jgi:drug/metabolite transporter (DMT)-like permease
MKRLLLLAFIWGWSFLFIKVSVDGMSPPTVACARVALGGITLHLIVRRRGLRMPRDRTSWRRFFTVALFGSALPFTMLAWGEERITSALAAVTNASTPLFTALAAAIYLRDRLKPYQTMGLVVGLVGVAVAAGLGGADIAESSISGSMASVLAGASYGFAFAYMRRRLTDIPPIIAAAGQVTAATALSLPFAVVTSINQGIDLDPHRVLAIGLLGVVGTGIAYVINYRIIAELGATRASLVTYLIPVVAVLVGVLVLDEPTCCGSVRWCSSSWRSPARSWDAARRPRPRGAAGTSARRSTPTSATSSRADPSRRTCRTRRRPDRISRPPTSRACSPIRSRDRCRWACSKRARF